MGAYNAPVAEPLEWSRHAIVDLGSMALVYAVSPSAQSSDRVQAEGGDIVITPIIHASVQIEHAGTVVQVDPWSAGDLSGAKPADLVLITDSPGHHLDPAAITRSKPGAPVVLTSAVHPIGPTVPCYRMERRRLRRRDG